MAGVPFQEPKMQEPYWRGVVLKWVERSGLINPGQNGIDLAACYDAFRCKLKGTYELQETTAVDFMRSKFPHFELRLGPENEIRECDYVYVFSLMLYFSCIRHPVPYFQNICKDFDEPFQYSMKAFLNAFVPAGGKTIDRPFLDKAFVSAKRSTESDGHRPDSSVQMITSTPNGKVEKKKPSPVTPQSVVLEWKVKNLSALLASARAENSTQEKQIEQLLQSVQTLEDERKRNLSKISALELREPCACMSDTANGLRNSPARSTSQLQKQIDAKNQLIETLEEELSRARETISTETERCKAMKKQWATLKEDHQLVTMTHQALREELAAKDSINQNLAETVDDLRRFIRENHVTNGQLMEPLESSFDFLEKSFKNMTPSDNASYTESESLAATVVDLKLKEKEHENETLIRQVQELQGKLEERCTTHSAELARVRDSMMRENEELRHTLESIEKTKTQLADELQKELGKVEDLTHLNQELENEKKRLTTEYESAKVSMIKKNEQLQQTVETIEITKTQLADKLEQELVKIDDLTRRNQELEVEKKRLTEEFEVEKASMIKKNEEQRQTLESIETTKTQQADELKKELAKIDDLTLRNQQLEVEKKQLVEEFEAEKVSMIEKNEDLRQKLDSIEVSKTQLADKLEQELAKIDDLTRRSQELEVEKKRLTEEFEVEKASMIKKNEEQQQRLDFIAVIKTQQADELKKELAKIDDLTRRNQELENEKKLLTEELEAAKLSMIEKNDEQRQTLESFEQTKTQLANKLETEQAKINDLTRRNQELQAEKKRLTEEYEAVKVSVIEKNEQLQQTAESFEQAKMQLADNLEKELAKTAELTRRNQELENVKKLLTEELETAKVSMIEKNEEQRQILESFEQTKTLLTDELKKKHVKIDDLTLRNQKLEDEKKQLMEGFDDEKVSMIEKNEDLKQRLDSIEQTKMQLADKLDKELAKTDALTRWNQELEVKKKQLVEEFEAEKASMIKKNEEQQQRLDFIEVTKTQLADELKKELAKIDDLTRRNQELESEKKLLTEELEAAKVSMIEKNEEQRQILESFEQTKTQLVDKLETELAKINDLSRRNQELEAEKKRLTEECEALKVSVIEKNAELRHTLESIEQIKTQQADELKKELAKIDDLTRRNQELESEKKLLTEELEAAKVSMIEKNEEQRQTLESFEQTKTQLETELAKINDLTRRNQELEAAKKQLTVECKALKVSVVEKNAELRHTLESIDQIKTQQADELKKELAKIDDLTRRNQELESEKKLLTEELEAAKVSMIEKNEEQRQTLESFEQTKMQLADNLDKEIAKTAELTRGNQELEVEKKRLTEEFEAAKLSMIEKIDQLQQTAESIEQTKMQLADELKNELGKIDDLTRQNQVLENEKKLLAEELEAAKASMLKQNEEVRKTVESVELAKIQLEDQLKKELATTEAVKHQLMVKEEAKVLGETLADNRQAEMLAKISLLQQSLEEEREKSEELNSQYVAIKKQADDLNAQCTKLMGSLSENRTEVSNLQQRLTAKDADLERLKEQYAKEQSVAKERLGQLQALVEKQEYDCETLSGKLLLARKEIKKLLEEGEQKMRESRILHQATLDKMKNRMVLLHEESIKKLEFDKKGMAVTIEGYHRKVENLETRCTMLQKQLAEMNERNLETRKENQLLQIKLKTMEEHCSERKSVLMPSQSSLRSNLQMEDEIGELFDNRYLVELKNGRSTPPDPTTGNHDRYTELYGRNSKLPPHLRTNYEAVAPDCPPPADDTVDNISTTFDDSSTGLISRRKVSGITSYKRPGPPTPSKRAGRLSLGGSTSEVQYRDALRDTNANAAGGAGDESITGRVGRTKTPGKFKQMMSASSLLSNFQPRDENTSPKRRLSWFNKGKKY